MKALLVIAHGSPRAEANVDVVGVADVVRARGAFDFVQVCYLDCNDPDIATGVDLCVDAGATEIVAVPYVLHSGKHLLRDIPRILDEAERRHANVRIVMGDYVGHRPAIAEVLLDRVRAVS
ncbi:MAG TPA: CbiX/SirB N-terminal domain-containing protein [Thermoanaerobaculia bacterium]